MWRAFGGSDLPRVAIVLNIPVNAPGVEALKIMSSPVAYFTKEQLVGELNDVIQNIKTEAEFLMTFDFDFVAGCVVTMLLAGVTCLKHEGFDEEREWRAIYSPNRLHSPLMESSTEIVGGVPQLVYNLPLDGAIPGVPAELELSRMFHRLIIGPSQYPWVMYERFVAALASAGVTDVGNRVVMSGIPIRS